MTRLVVVALGLVLVVAALAQPLPTIPVPADLALHAPAPDVPASIARFSGAWAHGAWDGVLPQVLVVESVDGTGRAQVVSAVGDLADNNVSRGWQRVTGRIEGDTLTFDVSARASVAYSFVDDALHGLYTSNRGRRTLRIILTRATLADVTRVPAVVPGVIPGMTVRIPMTEPGPEGKHLTLEATLYRPAGAGPHPVLLFNHGSTGGGTVEPTATLRPTRQAPFFVERGFAVLAPMRRGRGASDGEHAESESTCDPAILGRGLARAIEDVDAAVAYLRAQPWADPSRLLVGGQSRGGILSVAYAAERPGTVHAVINFAGGWTSDRCDSGGGGLNEATFAAAGRQVRVPVLWLYAEGDRYYAAPSIRRYHAAFAQAGGLATFHLLPAFDGDGHRLVDRVNLWRPAADEFMQRLR